jgi:nucleoside-diphosphate-sugar epimerase
VVQSFALCYAICLEARARQFNRWSGVPFVGLRFSNVMLPQDYERVSAGYAAMNSREAIKVMLLP